MICFEIYLKELCNNKMFPKILDFVLVLKLHVIKNEHDYCSQQN